MAIKSVGLGGRVQGGLGTVNVSGNRVAAKRLGFQETDDRRLRFTALFVVAEGQQAMIEAHDIAYWKSFTLGNEQGRKDACLGALRTENPFPCGGGLYDGWFFGWDAEQSIVAQYDD